MNNTVPMELKEDVYIFLLPLYSRYAGQAVPLALF